MPTGTVKFYSLRKGYGFIAPHDGEPDIFVHVLEVKRTGVERLIEGQQVTYEKGVDRGRAWAVDLVLGSVTEPNRSRKYGEGVVKWFNNERGYGFIVPDGGGRDVFVHISDLRLSGFETLAVDRRVSYYEARDSESGKEKAEEIKYI